MYDLIACSICVSYLTKLQEPQNADLITKSMILFGMSYGIIRHTRIFHPPPNKLKAHEEAEWRSRIVGTIHAVILTIGSIFCFREWPHYPENDAWTVTNPDVYYYPELFASIFAGYLQYDLFWLLWHKKENFDFASIVHHTLYIAITHYVLWGRFFARPFAWLSLGELSTPFLHVRWFFAVLNKKESKWYKLFSFLFVISFLFTRVLCYGLGLIDIWLAREILFQLPYGLYGVILGIHCGYALNLFWAGKVVSALKKIFKN